MTMKQPLLSSKSGMVSLALIPLVFCVIAVSNMQCTSGGGSGQRSAVDWPQYETNPFVIKLDIPAPEDSAGGVIVYDLTGDGLIDYLVTRPGYIAAYGHYGDKLWIKQVDLQVGGSSENHGLPGHYAPGVQAGDIDGNGKVEVLFLTRDGKLNIVDGSTGREKRSVKIESPEGTDRWEHVVIANFRGKGDRDILLQTTNNRGYRMGRFLAAYALDDLDKPLWTTDKFVACAHNGARIADINGDGRDQVPGPMFVDSDGTVRKLFDIRGHIDGLYIANVLPDNPGLEVVIVEEGGPQRVFLFNHEKLFWENNHKRQEPQNAAVGNFLPDRKGKEIWCRSRYNVGQKPWLFCSDGKLISEYEMMKVAPEGWSDGGVDVINPIHWTGGDAQLAVARERGRGLLGNVAIFEPQGGKFVTVFDDKTARLYVADVSGDWREEIIVLSGNELRVYHNPDPNPNINRPRLWEQQHYRRNKMTWNYYSP